MAKPDADFFSAKEVLHTMYTNLFKRNIAIFCGDNFPKKTHKNKKIVSAVYKAELFLSTSCPSKGYLQKKYTNPL